MSNSNHISRGKTGSLTFFADLSYLHLDYICFTNVFLGLSLVDNVLSIFVRKLDTKNHLFSKRNHAIESKDFLQNNKGERYAIQF